MKVWITKYALTTGIYAAEAEVCETVEDGTMIRVLSSYGGYFHKPNWWDNEADAIRRAEVMRKRKIAGLQKQLEKLKALKFEDQL